MRTAIAFALLLTNSFAFALEPAVTSKYSDTQFDFIVPPKHIESRCGDAMFGIERRLYSGNGPAWVCIVRDATSDRMVVQDWGYFDAPLERIVREPTPTDRNFILVNETNFLALDPVTLQKTAIGTISPPAATVNGAMLFQLLPENVSEILLNTSNGWEVRTYPGGQLLFSHTFQIVRAVGHFLSANSTQLLLSANDQFDLYDAHNGQYVASVPAPQSTTFFGFTDWTGGGQDNLYYANAYQQLVSQNAATGATVAAGDPQDFVLFAATPINWSGSQRALAGVWDFTVRVFDPVSGVPLYSEPLPVNHSDIVPIASLWATEYQTAGKQDLLWVTNGENLLYLPNGGSTHYVQSASRGFVVAGTTGPEFNLLLTADTYVSADSYAISHTDLVFRDPDTLAELWRRADPTPVGSQVFLAPFGSGADLVAIAASEGRIAAQRAVDGEPLWEIDTDKYSTGNGWYAFAVPPRSCSGDACKRLLIASIAFDSATHGSFVQLIDTRDGSTIWSSTPDGCLGCGSSVIALADVNGDGVPDILRMKPNNAPFSSNVQVLDGVTQQELWLSPDLGQNVWAIAVATLGTPNVAVLTPTNLTLLAASDGHVLASTPIQAQRYTVTPLAFAPTVDGGNWVFSADPHTIGWAPADLSQSVRTLPVPAIENFVGSENGILYAAGAEGVFRVEFPPDHLFANGFEP